MTCPIYNEDLVEVHIWEKNPDFEYLQKEHNMLA